MTQYIINNNQKEDSIVTSKKIFCNINYCRKCHPNYKKPLQEVIDNK